jgi:hypothetical protein
MLGSSLGLATGMVSSSLATERSEFGNVGVDRGRGVFLCHGGDGGRYYW